MSDRKPVFDIGDTLVPSHSKINEVIQEVVGDAPVMDNNRYNVYVPAEVDDWLEENGIDAQGREITERYLDWKRGYLADEVIPLLKKVNQDLGPIGFISDNSLAAKKFYQEQFDGAGLEYQGFVVSAEAGVEKPDPGIFRAFLEQRDEPPGELVYFGNYVERDIAAEKVGMGFVWVKQFHTFGSSYDGVQIDRLDYSSVRDALAEVAA